MAELIPAIERFTGLQTTLLEDCDVAKLNLAAARGLPGTVSIDEASIVATLDAWAQLVKVNIWQRIHRFDPYSLEAPTEFTYGNSLARFFCYYMLRTLQLDCGVVYHPIFRKNLFLKHRCGNNNENVRPFEMSLEKT